MKGVEIYIYTLIGLAIIMAGSVVAHTCMSGSYMTQHASGDWLCKVCDRGRTFMPYKSHTHMSCHNCSQVVDTRLEVVVQHCNLTHDADIQCVPGYFRQNDTRMCVQCSACKYLSVPCRNYTDTTCCAENDDVVYTEDVFGTCKERPVVCNRGYYFNQEEKNCSPCPANTYMPLNKHTYSSCLECSKLSNNLSSHVTIIQQCSSISGTIFGCTEGYFTDLTRSSLMHEVNCTKCRTCRRESQQCSPFNDAICALEIGNHTGITHSVFPKANISNSTKDDHSPSSVYITCGEGEYYYISMIINSSICRPCKKGTFMDEEKHKNSKCKNCQEFQRKALPITCSDNIMAQQNADCNFSYLVYVFFVVVSIFLLCLYVLYLFVFAKYGSQWLLFSI